MLPLGSYDVLVGKDWLEGHWSLVNCEDKVISFLNEEGIRHKIQGIKRPIQPRPITTTQLGKCLRKCCQIYTV